MAELKQVARRLREQGIHLGQPVNLGSPGANAHAVLRVAIGAPLVRAVALDSALGSHLSDRLNWLDAQIGVLSTKLDAVLAD
jgi:hypothetical protein